MSWVKNGKNRNLEKPIPGCLGRMVNLFDLNTGVAGNKLLTDKPHNDGSRRQSDVSRTSLVDDPMDDQMLSESRKSQPNKKSNGTPIKMLIAQEMSREEDCKQSPSNLVAKLMGLDTLPQRQSRSHSGSMEFLQQEHEIKNCQEHEEEYKDVYEIWQQHHKERCNENKMDLIREKFMEAKRLSTDEKLRQSKQFQDALEVLSSNKDLFLKFLQEPNSLFSQNLYNLQSFPPPPDSKRITLLRPSKLVDKTSSDFIYSPECCKVDDNNPNPNPPNPNPTQPTRIVILKPHKNMFDGDPEPEDSEGLESREVTEETLVSSVFSNGYIGDDSSFAKSEIDGNLSDSEVVSSPTSRHSWDYINRFNSHYSASSSRASFSPESSVCKEAKKRLSERWAMMASNKNVVEQRQIQRSSSTLGDMLALSDLKKPVKSEESKHDDDDNGPRNLLRSKSVPELGVEASSDDTKEKKLVKSSSFKGRVSSLFFSKNKKSCKEKDVPSPSSIIEGPQCIIEQESCSRLYKQAMLPESDQPSPISVLEQQFEEDDCVTDSHRHPKLNEHGPMKYNLIDKSPPIGSIARTLSWDDSTTLGSSTPYTGKPSPPNPHEEEQECLLYVETLLSIAGLSAVGLDSFIARWHSPDSPLDPSLRDKYMNEKDAILVQTKRSHIMKRLVFDCVNEALMEIADVADTMSSGVVGECVWRRMKEWLFSGEEEEEEGVVEEVVRREVMGRGWVEGLKMEIGKTRKEIEEKLLEELVEESVLEFTGRA